MNCFQQPVIFRCNEDHLVGIITRPLYPESRGLLIVVGGPQYRVGSHRQFALLATSLAGRGIPVMRFDYRGMGDSTGRPRTFEEVGEDLGCAVGEFFARVPQLCEVAIWGLCDAASAALFHAAGDARVTGLVLLNPWMRTEEGEARAYVRHYYLRRLRSRELWLKLWRGQLDILSSASALASSAGKALAGNLGFHKGRVRLIAEPQSLPERMADSFANFNGRVLIILSENDLVAKEFEDVTGASKRWRRLLSSQLVTTRKLPDATHTFSSRTWRDQVASWTASWLRSW